MTIETPIMYQESHFPDKYRINRCYENGVPVPPDLDVITAAITENAASEACYKMLMRMHGLHWATALIECKRLKRVAEIRFKAAKDEADALTAVDYERDVNSQLRIAFFQSLDLKTTLHIDPNLPNQTTMEPFHSRDKALNEIRNELISIYVQQISHYNTLIQMEAAGLLNNAKDTYENAVSAAANLKLDLFSAMTSLTQPQGE